jgi:hypothetical protein
MAYQMTDWRVVGEREEWEQLDEEVKIFLIENMERIWFFRKKNF